MRSRRSSRRPPAHRPQSDSHRHRMSLDLNGRVALVTGASRGIGRAIALMLGASGATVVAGARGENARETADAIVAAGGRAQATALDLTEPATIDAAVRLTLETHGRLDIL